MESAIFDFSIKIDWNLIRLVSEIDRFDAAWTAIERREGQSLKQLKTIATIKSVGASTRIEGAKMSDEEIDIFLKTIDITKLTDRDTQEVAGYFDVLDVISNSHKDIDIAENNIKNLHNILMKYSQKDQWHKGNYKQHSNAVEASFPDGRKQVIFHTAEAGFVTDDAVKKLVAWYNTEQEVHSLVKSAVFVYEFLSIHPFQDGNGRISRLLSTLLLMRNGYKWIEYISFEHEIENRKSEYYQVLRSCQAMRPNEDVTAWVFFFLNALKNIQLQLMRKLKRSSSETQLTPREKTVLSIIQNHSGIQSGGIAEKSAIPLPTVKRILAEMLTKGIIEKSGTGRSTSYIVK